MQTNITQPLPKRSHNLFLPTMKISQQNEIFFGDFQILFFIKYNYRCQILDMEAQACTNAKMVLFSREKIPPNATLEIGREKHPFANWFIALFPDTS